MEVHHHSHTARKKWTHYFWEFFMLFLAVTAGFFVENQREHYIERKRAHQFAISLIEDLIADTAELNGGVRITKNVILRADSLLNELDKPAVLQNDTLLQFLNSRLWAYSFYDPQLGTYNQMKNSGSLRYFKKDLITYLNTYEKMANYIVKISDKALDFRTNQFLPVILRIQNTRFIRALNKEIVYTGPVFSDKPGKLQIEEWYTYVSSIKNTYARIVMPMESQAKHAVILIGLLKKAYHLK